MALAPRFAGQKLAAAGAETRHTLELYLDYVCPFSAKQFNTFYDSVAPMISDPKGPYANKVQVIFRQHVQPWHPSSTLTHEAALAVLQLAPTKFWAFSKALFSEQREYFDENTAFETRNDTYSRLASLGSSVGVDKGKMFELLQIGDEPGPNGELNTGNGVTNDLKLMIRANRVVGVHVSPTVFFDGIEEKSISSSFTAEQWKEWLDKNLV